jgi:hypothetical protein
VFSNDATTGVIDVATTSSEPELAAVGAALDAILRQQEPFPAVVMILAYPGVPASWWHREPALPLVPVLPVSFRKADRQFDFFSTVTTLGTPQNVTGQEIRIECFFPANAATERAARALADEV